MSLFQPTIINVKRITNPVTLYTDNRIGGQLNQTKLYDLKTNELIQQNLLIQNKLQHEFENKQQSTTNSIIADYRSQTITKWNQTPVFKHYDNNYTIMPSPTLYIPIKRNHYTNIPAHLQYVDGYDTYDEIDKCNCSIKIRAQKSINKKQYILSSVTGCKTNTCITSLMCVECTQRKHVQSCDTGQCCSNKRIQQQQYKSLYIEFTNNLYEGYGLYTSQYIHKNEFIIEYVGDICDDDEINNRLKQYNNNNIPIYIMSLDKYYMIDATYYGNISRYINHSCDPNCEVQRWIVNNKYCIAIFALRDIDVNNELTFHYNFELYGNTPNLPCCCNSKNCKGVLGS